MRELQHQLFEKIMSAGKRLKYTPSAILIEPHSFAKHMSLELSFMNDDDPVFPGFSAKFTAHIRHPFEQCEFALLCKPTQKAPIRIKSPRPISTAQFDFAARKWQLFVYDDHDYATRKSSFTAESPDILLEALSHYWHINDLNRFRLDIVGPNQMKLPFTRNS